MASYDQTAGDRDDEADADEAVDPAAGAADAAAVDRSRGAAPGEGDERSATGPVGSHAPNYEVPPGESAPSPDEPNVIENPVTGEVIRFLEEPTDASGDGLRFEFWARPHIVGPAAHVHPRQEEYFEVRAGTLSAHVGREDLTLQAGERMRVPAGTPHAWWNGGDEELHGYVELRPSMDVRDEFEALFALGRAGRTDEHGVPNLLQVAVLLHTYPNTIYRAGLPIWVQKVGIELLAPVGRMLGYKARYPEIVGAERSERA